MQYYKHTVRRPISYASNAKTDASVQTAHVPPTKPTPETTVSSNPLSGFPLAMAYVPYQSFEDLNEPAKALECGTLFEALYMPFYGQRRRNGI